MISSIISWYIGIGMGVSFGVAAGAIRSNATWNWKVNMMAILGWPLVVWFAIKEMLK